MNNERIWTLIARKLAGEATPEDLLELYGLLQENPEIHYSLEVFDELWQQNDFAKRRPIAAYARLLKKMEQQGIAFPPGERTPLNPAPVHRKKRSFPKLSIRPLMLRNNLKVTWRNLARNKAYSIINITGLAIGMAASILILLWIYDELNFDKFHKNRDRIYDVLTRAAINGKREAWFGTSMLLAPVLKENYPEVEEVTRINYVSAFMFHTGEKHIGGRGLIADPAFLKIFDYPLLQGSRTTALNDPRSLVVTESFAKKLFANTDVMGKLVRVDSNANFIISGVLKDIPHNSDLSFDYILPFSYNGEVHWDRENWESTMVETVIMLRTGVSEKSANARFANIVKTHSKLNHELFLHSWVGKDPNLSVPFYKYHTDKDFVKTMGMGLVAGRDIDAEQFPTDTSAILLNQATVKVMGFEDAIGKIVKSREGIWHVVGVVSNFVAENPFESAVPTVIQGPGENRWFGVASF